MYLPNRGINMSTVSFNIVQTDEQGSINEIIDGEYDTEEQARHVMADISPGYFDDQDKDLLLTWRIEKVTSEILE